MSQMTKRFSRKGRKSRRDAIVILATSGHIAAIRGLLSRDHGSVLSQKYVTTS
jgi:hypothetical protein